MSDDNEKSSWLEPLPEEFASGDDVTGRRMLVAALSVIILAIFGGLIWYSYMGGNNHGPVPVVRADKSVIKEKPNTPGGMQVPDQDKDVFDRITNENSEKDETMSASGELPLERPKDSQESDTKGVIFAEAEDTKNNVVEKQDDAPNQPMELPEKTIDAAPEQAAAIIPSSQGKSGDFLVQLGAFSSEDTVSQLWNKMKVKHADILAGLDLDIMMVDLGKKGVFYRMRAGMIEDKEAARKICDALKAKKQPCIVVVK